MRKKQTSLFCKYNIVLSIDINKGKILDISTGINFLSKYTDSLIIGEETKI